MKLRFLASLASLAFVGALAAACSSAEGLSLDPNRSNCDSICDKARDCLKVDQGSCSDKCTTKAKDDSSYASSVEACGKCVVDKTCPDVASCSGDCLSALAGS